MNNIPQKIYLQKRERADGLYHIWTSERQSDTDIEYVLSQPVEEETVYKKDVSDLLHTILNCQQEVYSPALRMEVVTVGDIKAAFDEYFSIESQPVQQEDIPIEAYPYVTDSKKPVQNNNWTEDDIKAFADYYFRPKQPVMNKKHG